MRSSETRFSLIWKHFNLLQEEVLLKSEMTACWFILQKKKKRKRKKKSFEGKIILEQWGTCNSQRKPSLTWLSQVSCFSGSHTPGAPQQPAWAWVSCQANGSGDFLVHKFTITLEHIMNNKVYIVAWKIPGVVRYAFHSKHDRTV